LFFIFASSRQTLRKRGSRKALSDPSLFSTSE
jgi:hypothetical protein